MQWFHNFPDFIRLLTLALVVLSIPEAWSGGAEPLACSSNQKVFFLSLDPAGADWFADVAEELHLKVSRDSNATCHSLSLNRTTTDSGAIWTFDAEALKAHVRDSDVFVGLPWSVLYHQLDALLGQQNKDIVFVYGISDRKSWWETMLDRYSYPAYHETAFYRRLLFGTGDGHPIRSLDEKSYGWVFDNYHLAMQSYFSERSNLVRLYLNESLSSQTFQDLARLFTCCNTNCGSVLSEVQLHKGLRLESTPAIRGSVTTGLQLFGEAIDKGHGTLDPDVALDLLPQSGSFTEVVDVGARWCRMYAEPRGRPASACHGRGHNVGRAGALLYKCGTHFEATDGEETKAVFGSGPTTSTSTSDSECTEELNAIYGCGASFSLGCFHGAVQGTLLKLANESDKFGLAGQIDLLEAIAGDVLQPSVDDHGQITYNSKAAHLDQLLFGAIEHICPVAYRQGVQAGECFHGIGHAAFMLSGYNTSHAMRGCEGASKTAAQLFYCNQVRRPLIVVAAVVAVATVC